MFQELSILVYLAGTHYGLMLYACITLSSGYFSREHCVASQLKSIFFLGTLISVCLLFRIFMTFLFMLVLLMYTVHRTFFVKIWSFWPKNSRNLSKDQVKWQCPYLLNMVLVQSENYFAEISFFWTLETNGWSLVTHSNHMVKNPQANSINLF